MRRRCEEVGDLKTTGVGRRGARWLFFLAAALIGCEAVAAEQARRWVRLSADEPGAARVTVKAMLDCPDANQTSPTRMFLSVSVFDPETVISKGPPASRGSSFTIQCPSSPAAVCFL